MRFLDLSTDPSIDPLLRLVQSMTGGTNSHDILSDFMGQYGRVRPIDAFVGIKADDTVPAAYRVLYAVRAVDAVNGRASHTRDVRPEALARIPLQRGGFFADMIATPRPKMVHGIEAIDDPTVAPMVQGMNACMCLPIYQGEHVFEWSFAFSTVPEGVIQPRDVGSAVMVANMVGAANRHADMTAEVNRLNEALRDQLDGIARVQQSLLPARIPEIPGLEIATSYLTSDDAGGDYYDFFELPGERWGILIADVSGHGAPAATVMAMLHAILHCYDHATDAEPDPAAVMRFANRRIIAAKLDGMFVTAFFAVHDPLTGEFAYCNCGHNPPRLKVGTSGEVDSLDGGGAAVPLGVLADAEFCTERVTLGPKDTIVMYTDGITEAFSPQKEMFGTRRLDEALVKCTGQPDCVVDGVHRALYDHRRAATRDDDQTIVAIRHHGICAVPAADRDRSA